MIDQHTYFKLEIMRLNYLVGGLDNSSGMNANSNPAILYTNLCTLKVAFV
jgi:hypothetical protein